MFALSPHININISNQDTHNQTALIGSNEDRGRGWLILFILKWVNVAKPMMESTIPRPERAVIGTLNTIDVTMMANSLRIQLRAAW